jgi:hypothetical protein
VLSCCNHRCDGLQEMRQLGSLRLQQHPNTLLQLLLQRAQGATMAARQAVTHQPCSQQRATGRTGAAAMCCCMLQCSARLHALLRIVVKR